MQTGEWIHHPMSSRLKQLESAAATDTPLFERLLSLGSTTPAAGGSSTDQSGSGGPLNFLRRSSLSGMLAGTFNVHMPHQSASADSSYPPQHPQQQQHPAN